MGFTKAKKSVLHIFYRVTFSGVLGLVVLFIVFSLVIGSVRAIQVNFQRQLEVDRLAQEVEILKVEVKMLRLQNQYYQTDEYLELQSRELLGLARPGEKAINLPRTEAKASPAELSVASEQVSLEDRSNFKQWLYFLFSGK